MVELASATLCRLADAPPAATAARAAVEEIESASRRVPLTLGVGGELQIRTAMFNDLCGDKLFDPFARSLGCAAVRIRKGSGKRFHVRRVDGKQEIHELPEERTEDVEAVRTAALAGADLENRRRVAGEMAAVPPPRPKWWQLWKWLGYSKLRKQFETRRAQHQLAELSVGEAQRKFDDAERIAAEVIARTEPARERYLTLLRGLSSGGADGVGVQYIEVEVVGGMLPEGVEVLELTGASRSGAEVDAVVIIQSGGVYAPGIHDRRPRLGDLAQVIAGLPMMLAHARSLGIGRRFRDKISDALTTLAEAIQRKEDDFRARIAALEAKRVTDPAAFTEAQLANLDAHVTASVNAVLEHASVHLGMELAQVRAEWVEALARAGSGSDLAAAVARIDGIWESTFKRIAEEVRILALGGVGGSARDLYVPLVAPLVPKGLPEQHAKPPRAAPQLPPVAILPTLTGVKPTRLDETGFFAGLFRSFETKRTEVRAKAAERLERIQEMASIELMEAEPKFHLAIREALVNQLATALQLQHTALETALATERVAIAAEQEQLGPLIAVRDAVRQDLAKLAAQITRIETEQPALSVAATAAETASLSH